MDQAAIHQARRFNRIVAERIGALTDRFLGRGRPMGESRVLWEIGADGVELRRLRARLGLDSGYASRVLRSLEHEGLITLQPSAGDARVREVRLTPAGLDEYAAIDRRSDAVAWGYLEPLSAGQRARLLRAMGEVEALLRASMVRIAVEDPGTADAQWCIDQYFAELNARFEGGFDFARSGSTALHEFAPPEGLLLLARLRDRPIGCGALKFHAGAPPDIKRLWVAAEARGLGLGRRLLAALEGCAREAGANAVRLDTNRVLAEAIALYRNTGYDEVPRYNDEPYAHHWFAKRLDRADGLAPQNEAGAAG